MTLVLRNHEASSIAKRQLIFGACSLRIRSVDNPDGYFVYVAVRQHEPSKHCSLDSDGNRRLTVPEMGPLQYLRFAASAPAYPDGPSGLCRTLVLALGQLSQSCYFLNSTPIFIPSVVLILNFFYPPHQIPHNPPSRSCQGNFNYHSLAVPRRPDKNTG